MDPNSVLGSLDSYLALLLFLIGLTAGTLIVAVISRLLQVSIITPLLVLFGHLAFGTLRYWILGPLSNDGIVYDRQAITVAGQLGLELPMGFAHPLDPGKEGFPYFLGLIYSELGRAPFSGIVINCIAAGLTAALILASASLISSRIQTKYVLIFMLANPVVLTLGPAVLRESLSWLGIIGTVYAYLLLTERKAIMSGVAVALSSLALLYGVRTSLMLLCIVAAVAATAVQLVYKRFGVRWLVTAGVLAIAGFLILGETVLSLLGFSSERLIISRNYLMESATSGYQPLLPRIDFLGLPGEILATIPNVFLGPFPWELSLAPVWLWIAFGAIFWWIAIVITVQKLRSGFAHHHVVWLTSFALVLVAALGITMTNYGIAARIRTIPILVLVVVLSIREPEKSEERVGQGNHGVTGDELGIVRNGPQPSYQH